jgi:precorrin-6A/cobalt-precorrin-6A reductase
LLAAPRRVLVLGGTGEGRELAETLVRHGHYVVTSMAGVTADTMKPAGVVRAGGFGGSEGLMNFLRRERIDVVADASHPFAAQISAHACAATSALGLDLVRFERPPWKPQSGDRWISAGNYRQAADALAPCAGVLLTVGRRGLSPFLARADLSGVARIINVPEMALPQAWLLLVARPPLRVETEMVLMREQRITVTVTKNSGGEATAAKLEAARMLGLPVIMIERPRKPPARIVHAVEGVVDFLRSKSGPTAA